MCNHSAIRPIYFLHTSYFFLLRLMEKTKHFFFNICKGKLINSSNLLMIVRDLNARVENRPIEGLTHGEEVQI